MNPALRKLIRKRRPSPADIDALIQDQDFPLVDGTDVTFVFRGEADAVYLRCWISGLDTAQPFQTLEGTDLWATTIELPKGSRIEYKFEVVKNGNKELILDPLNDVVAHDPFGANSVCQAFGYERPEWTLHDPAVTAGLAAAARRERSVFGESGRSRSTCPPTFRENRRYPLLVVHDGVDYLKYADLKTVLDNLIHRLEIPADDRGPDPVAGPAQGI